jgi:colicin import membrane protein
MAERQQRDVQYAELQEQKKRMEAAQRQAEAEWKQWQADEAVRQQAVEEGLTKKLDAESSRRKAAEERGNAVEQHAKAAERSAAAAAANLSATAAALAAFQDSALSAFHADWSNCSEALSAYQNSFFVIGKTGRVPDAGMVAQLWDWMTDSKKKELRDLLDKVVRLEQAEVEALRKREVEEAQALARLKAEEEKKKEEQAAAKKAEEDREQAEAAEARNLINTTLQHAAKYVAAEENELNGQAVEEQQQQLNGQAEEQGGKAAAGNS